MEDVKRSFRVRLPSKTEMEDVKTKLSSVVVVVIVVVVVTLVGDRGGCGGGCGGGGGGSSLGKMNV